MRILIAVATFNREKITKLCLEQIMRYKDAESELWVYDDQSTDYNVEFLNTVTDHVIRFDDKKGIHHSRWFQFRQFLETDFDAIYMTDNDTIHDPTFAARLREFYKLGSGDLPVSLYNTKYHSRPEDVIYRKDVVSIKKTAPGVSMMYDRKMVETIVEVLRQLDKDPEVAWDLNVLNFLGLPWVTSETSYLEHFGADGIHNSDFDFDRATSPTAYLAERRQPIIDYLTGATQTLTIDL